MPAATLLIQGTASGVGKSAFVTALARLFVRAGWRVAPFKAQNLSLNAVPAAGVLPGEGEGEIGRAQAVQAAACGLAPSLDMNPVLLKPDARGCQLVVRGSVRGWLGAGEAAAASAYGPDVVAAARAALDRLRAAHDLVLIEGAGSPAEINLLERDLANRMVADWTDGPILLVGDIERGGVFASLLGTWSLSPHRGRVRGFVINKLHGGAASLAPGLRALEDQTGVATLGVIPFRDPELPEEDSLGLGTATPAAEAATGWPLRIAVLRFPHLANFTDFAALERQPGVALRYVWSAEELLAADVIVLPGTKSTLADLAALRHAGLEPAILAAARAGKSILGICGGYQMLGREVVDLEAVEAPAPARVAGLNLLPVITEFTPTKRVEARGPGFFIHHGRLRRLAAEPLLQLDHGEEEGCRLGAIAGTALHDLLQGRYLVQILAQWRAAAGLASVAIAHFDLPGRIEAWADHVARHLDCNRVAGLVAKP